MPTPHATIPGAVIFDRALEKDADAKIDLPIDTACPVLIPISKNVRGRIQTEPHTGHPCPCKCKHPTLGQTILTYSMQFRAEWLLRSNQGCDQVKTAMLLDGCNMSIKGDMKLREWDCPDNNDDAAGPNDDLHIGCQIGKFVMYRPIDPANPAGGQIPVFTGDFIGVVGLDTIPCSPANQRPRCCQPNHVQGTLNGRGVGPMEDCTLCATYEGHFMFLEGRDMCQPQNLRWDINLDGVVCCPCPDGDDAPDKKQQKK